MNHHVSPRLQREHVHCPITALEFFRPSSSPNGPLYVLSGEDTHLKIYDADTQRLCASVHVFGAQPIHGIALGGDDALIWGGPSVTVLSRAYLEDLIARGGGEDDRVVPRVPPAQVVQAPDWIYHGAISPSQPDTGAIVTAHNEVIPLHISQDDRRALRLGRLQSPPSRPILYSAQVRWTGGDDDGVLVAAGTVFGEIIVWRCRFVTTGADDEDVEVLFVFTGHEGSIFGVDISPDLVVHPETKKSVRLLASCSDDRTVRIWDISRTEATRQRLATQKFIEARETGFGENASASTGLEDIAGGLSSKPIAMAMGHVSRIWNVRFSPESARYSSTERRAKSLTLYSFGEDATAQEWRLDLGGERNPVLGTELSQSNGAVDEAATLTNEMVFHNHSGKHIWSSALLWPMSPTSPNKTLIATGGSDGKIHLTTAENGQKSDEDDVPTQADMEIDNVVGEPFHMYSLLSGTFGLATTASGRLFNGSLTGSEICWTEVPLSQSIREDLAKYQTIKSAGPNTVLLGSPSGQLYLYHWNKVQTILKMSRKIADIFCLPVESISELGFVDPQQVQSTTVPAIVTTMGSSQVRLLLLEPDSVDMVTYDSVVELEKGFIVTAVGCCQEYLIFGSRIGALLVHKWNAEEGCFQQVARLNRPGSKDAVSSITALPPKLGSPSPYFLTTSRDGRYRTYEITKPGTVSEISVHLRHEAVPPLGPMIEGAFFSIPSAPGAKPELILCGFRSKDFIVWNETRQQELANVECGGAHRAFTYRVDPSNPEKVAFIWTKASRTCIHSQNEVTQRALKSGGHGREIKAVTSWGEYLATGAEDTEIRIWRYEKEGALRCLAVIEKHTTGIQCLKWAGEKYLISSSGNEELAVWRITRLDRSDYEGLSVTCEAAYPDKTRDGDLRIMSFDVEIMETVQKGGEAEEVLCLSLVLSNSTLKTYRYSKTDGFTLLAEGRYTGACLMQIRHLRIAAEEDGSWEAHVLTAATDGHVATWKMTTTTSAASPERAGYALVEVSRLHQSSVKALDLRPVRPSRDVSQPTATEQSSLVVVTGGDDNAIGHIHLQWAGDHFKAVTRSLANGAHAAAVTGLCITGVGVDSEDDSSYRVELCTSSTDQRVKTWRITVGDGSVGKTALLANRYSAIADCGDLESLDKGGKVVVAGVGMEMWRV
ncbi:Regulator of Ty1 transposition protein 10 [Cytospora mali]|uniref:Regulator of Ty1 transposition protein 10 n=1 Tax=Cytospora mali TaxID=578113 RepID=A0A194V954_CYTMA|nr:Regulator of Ty1 transposition protein 10 [Valsa mali var. pyri (nom. inval.)]